MPETEEYNPEEEVFRVHHEEIQKTGVRQCEVHRWRKLSDTEIACTLCPTANIVKDFKDITLWQQ